MPSLCRLPSTDRSSVRSLPPCCTGRRFWPPPRCGPGSGSNTRRRRPILTLLGGIICTPSFIIIPTSPNGLQRASGGANRNGCSTYSPRTPNGADRHNKPHRCPHQRSQRPAATTPPTRYVHTVAGIDASAKSFRTWAGTVLAAAALGGADLTPPFRCGRRRRRTGRAVAAVHARGPARGSGLAPAGEEGGRGGAWRAAVVQPEGGRRRQPVGPPAGAAAAGRDSGVVHPGDPGLGPVPEQPHRIGALQPGSDYDHGWP